MALVTSFTQVDDNALHCFLVKRPDVLYEVAHGDANMPSAELRSALDGWWVASFGGYYQAKQSVGDYLTSIGCPVNAPVSILPIPGGNTKPGVSNPLISFVTQNPALVIGGGLLGLIMLKKLRLI